MVLSIKKLKNNKIIPYIKKDSLRELNFDHSICMEAVCYSYPI